MSNLRVRKFSLVRICGWSLTVILLAGIPLAAGPAQAQRTKFDPRLGLTYYYRNRVNYFGEEARDDSSLRLNLALPVSRQLKTGSLRFVYQTSFEKFEEFDDLDYLGHRLSLDLSLKPSQRSSLNLGANYRRRRDQLDSTSVDTVDLVAFRQLSREQASVDLGYSRQLGRRWGANVVGRASGWRFYELVGDGSELLPDTEDRAEFAGSFGANRSFSDRSALGFSIGARLFDLDRSGQQDAVSASLVYQREVIEKSSIALRIGGFRMQTGQFVDDVQQTRSGVQGSLSINRQFRRMNGVLLAGHAPNVGGARIGTAVVSFAQIGLTDSYFRNWGWAVYSRMGYRDPNDPDVSVAQTLTAGAAVNVKVQKYVGLNLNLTWADQLKGEAEATAEYFRLGAAVVWHPLGWSKIASEGI